MRVFLKRLLVASQWGAALSLAAVGCESKIVGPDGIELEPAPEPTCSGPIYSDPTSPYSGQCCQELLCQPPVDGQCPAALDAHPENLPPGSGSCECGEREGPFANPVAATGKDCCYLVGSIGCEGRPLVVNGAARLAPVERSRAWSGDVRSPAPALTDEDRAALLAGWTRRARFEHASIASFARFSLSLLALGAPPELVRAAHGAADDEIEHARTCFALASGYAGEPIGPGKLDVSGAFDALASLEDVTLGTVLQACIGEAIAALEMAAAGHAACDDGLRDALARIAEEETRHAELGWAFVRWALARDAGLAGPVAAAFEVGLAAALEPEAEVEVPGGLGFLSTEEKRSLRAAAVERVLRPAARSLFAPRALHAEPGRPATP